ncbi:hypothetical protein DA73_0400002490 [Tolypothrix bouteillei VB521301]|uniref:DUF6888 domain-containing protein n=2 Tax=Nostocales TaxID=1161 RepID=A0A8S9TFM0_9CYAN|nr:hypothetical protein DA73_0400002490 [Tolypothrix bouteillei VB521301]
MAGGVGDKPTREQLEQLYRLSYQLTKMLRPINLVTIDDRNGKLVILAGDEIDITVDRQGQVSYEQTGFQSNE